MIANTDVRALTNEWKALSNEKGELLYNKKGKRLENMTYRNAFTKFFKLIWYKLRGYSRNTNLLYKGMDSLLSRSIGQISSEQKSEDPDRKMMLDTMRKVSNVILSSMIAKHQKKGHTANRLAAEHLKARLDKTLNEISSDSLEPKAPKSQLETAEEEDEQPQADETGAESLVSDTAPPKAREAEVSEPAASPIPTSPPTTPPPSPTTNISPSGAFVPPPPPNPLEMKKLQMDKVIKEIETQKQLVNYYKLKNLKAETIYKHFASAKSNLQVYQEKTAKHNAILEKVSMKTLDQTIASIEAQLKTKPQGKITIMQAGKPVPFEPEAAREALDIWKGLRHEIIDTRQKLKQFSQALKKAENKTIKKDGFHLTCRELDERIADLEASHPKEIEENQGLNFHESRLHQLKNNLRTLQGKPTIKKPGQKTSTKPMTAAPHANKQQMQGALSFAAAQIAAKKAQAKPDLFKLG